MTLEHRAFRHGAIMMGLWIAPVLPERFTITSDNGPDAKTVLHLYMLYSETIA